MYFPDQSGLVDMLIDKEQRFSINADLSKTNQLVLKFYSSPENERLNFYKHFMAEQSQEIQAAEEQLAYSSNATDSVKWIHKLSDIDKKIQEYREDLIHRNPGTFLSTLLIALRDPILPGSLKIQRNAEDSAAARRSEERRVGKEC